MIIIFTNRSLNPTGERTRGSSMFGDSLNTLGSSELRIAIAEKDVATGDWRVDLQEEWDSPGELPSQILFNSVLDRIRDGSLSPKWVVAVHGYGQTFLDSLEEAHELEQRYRSERLDEQVNVIMFSWPSKPGGIVLPPVTTYRKAQAAALPSASALANVLKRVWDFLAVPALPEVRNFTICLHVHSQGNLVLEIMTRTKALEGSQIRLDTIILHQADVDAHDHSEWVDKMNFGSDVVITLNAYDRVLRLSDAINPERLGITRTGLRARATYFDFTGGNRIGNEHNLFLKIENKLVKLFCRRALTGFPVHQMGGELSGFWFDESVGAWRLGLHPSGPESGDHQHRT